MTMSFDFHDFSLPCQRYSSPRYFTLSRRLPFSLTVTSRMPFVMFCIILPLIFLFSKIEICRVVNRRDRRFFRFFLPRSVSIVQDMNGGYFARFFAARNPQNIAKQKIGFEIEFRHLRLKARERNRISLILKIFCRFSLKPMYIYLPL